MAHPSYPEVQVQDPTPASAGPGSSTRPTPPRTPYEEVVYGIWTDVLGDVLGATEFGVHDDFFELGGHSLAAPRIVARIRKTLGVHVPVREFFGCRTVASLASLVAAQSSIGPQTIGRRADRAEAVLSFDQQRIWLEHQMQPSLAYNVHGRQRLVGPLDVGAFAASIRAILVRHEALRTRFPVVNGQPVQVVDDLPDDWQLDVHDLRDVADPAQRSARARRLADEQASTAFDLTAGPLIRCLLIRLDETEHLLSLTAHHIVCDDWSIGLFARELSALYAAGGDPGRAGLEPLPIQYRDYAAWQREHLVGETLERTVGYWREHLAGAPGVLTMPLGRRRAGAREHGEWTRGRLTEEETRALHTFCRAQGVSPFMLLMATLATVLARWSGQRDVVIGVPTAGRNDTGTDTLIGFLVNTLPIRVDLRDEPTFTDLLARVRRVCLDGYAHADAPLDVLIQQLDVPRDPRHTPLFQVVLSLLNTSTATAQLPGISVESMDGTTSLPTKLDLTVNVQETDRRMHFQLDYNPERYDPTLVEALVTQLEALLRAVVEDPSRGVLDYPLGPAPAVDPDGPGPAVDPHGASDSNGHGPAAPDSNGHAPAGTEPAAPPAPEAGRAAVVTGEGTYSYGWLGHAVQSIGRALPRTGHVDLVHRPGAAFVAAVLACVEAGAEFSIVEADTPASATVFDVAEHPVDPDGTGPAFTGRGVADRAWAAGRLPLAGTDRVAVLTSRPGHRVSAIVNTAAAGATLLVPPAGADLDGWLAGQAATAAFLGPPQLRARTAPLPHLRYAVIDNSGELVPHDIVRLRRLAPGCHALAVYGTDAGGRPLATYDVPEDFRPGSAPLRVPLGHPLPGNPADRPASVGEVTQLRFGARHTGHLARRWADGTLEYLGHPGTDPAQDRIQTYHALRDLPEVTDAVLVELADPDGNPALVGYVTGDEPIRTGAEIRQQLLLRLPDHLTPRTWWCSPRCPAPRTATTTWTCSRT
ncbi:condensation domain-containing protein [Plantactinospora sp. KBS50]|uniref:condensation domain-containing protein n=1 Tax=Plantactinospora sp. KBS50 TaxID=2024580 RepID=UPI000BAAD946|nr:condensation domain-containing protein [Plantactinospora sp. KBS50]ASW54323.1 hypothetical protein CIK06_09150 [Plantactinospora sp. KBS50]